MPLASTRPGRLEDGFLLVHDGVLLAWQRSWKSDQMQTGAIMGTRPASFTAQWDNARQRI